VIADGFPTQWIDGVGTIVDIDLSVADLDEFDAALTTCATAIAATGTIVLDHGPGQGRRARSLVRITTSS